MASAVTVRFFGNFLIDRGLVSREHIAAATRRMREVNRTLAAMARERGWLTAAQVEQIHAQQLVRHRVWGQQAIELGLLEPAQVMRLLADQRARRIRMGEALLELGCIARPALERALAEVSDERARAGAVARRLPPALESCAPARYVLEHYAELTVRIACLPTRLGAAWEWKGEGKHELRVQISLMGDAALQIGIAAEREFGAVLAQGWMGLEPHQVDPALLLDLFGEFAAVIARGARSDSESQGVHLEAGPPEHDVLPSAGTAVEFATPYGRGLLILKAD